MRARLLVPFAAILLVTAGHAFPLPGSLLPLDEVGPRRVDIADGHAPWTIDLGLSLAAGKGVTTPAAKAKSVCALGDVDGDGYDDILVKVPPGLTGGRYKFEALAGPDFTRSLWRAAPQDGKLLKCGADVTGDGVKDPIVVTPPATTPTVPNTPVTTIESGTTTITPLDGSSGNILAEIGVESGSTTIGAPVGSAGTVQSGDVVPAGNGALLVVDTTDVAVDAELLPGGSAGGGPATIVVVDETGAPQGTIETPPGADAVSAAPLPNPEGLPDVVVLAETAISPIEGLPAGVPSVSLSEGDGTVLWTSDQEPTVGVPVLLPSAGDVDGDGIDDMIYITVPPEVSTIPSGGYEVISGADGSTIVDSGPAQSGLVTALPLDDVTGNGSDEILVIEQPAPDQPIVISAQGSNGQPIWTAEIPAEATPINTVTDPATGNTIGFSDLTGDGIADVAVSAPTGNGTLVVVIDGATGEIVWSQEFQGADAVTAVPTDPVGGVDLVVVDTGGGLSVIGVDGATGQTMWETSGAGASSEAADVVPIGDVDGDGVGDILVTVGLAGADGSVDPDAPGSSHIISGASGDPIWDGGNDGGDSGIRLQSNPTATDESLARSSGASWWPWFLIVLAAGLLVVVVVAWKRRRRGDQAQ